MAILGHLLDLKAQHVLHGALAAAITYVAAFNPRVVLAEEAGYVQKITIRGTSLFAIHQVYRTKPVREARYEAHRKYIDLQFIWSGQECMGIAAASGLRVIQPYDRANDIEFFKYKKESSIIMGPGMAVILFPEDAHAPGLAIGRPQVVRKTVVKIRR